MSDLFARVALNPGTGRRPNPLFLEFPVPSGTAPYLVSGTRGPVWLGRAVGGVVRSALRRGPWVEERDALEAARDCFAEGAKNSWGNWFPLSKEGLAAAAGRLDEYGLAPVEFLAHPDEKVSVPSRSRLTRVNWMPRGAALAVPADRELLGVRVELEGSHALVAHNPARALVLLGEWESAHPVTPPHAGP